MPAASSSAPRLRGPQRMLHMWRLFRREQQDPAPFYRYLASELVRDLEGRHGPLEGQRLLDLGCGPGWYAEALEPRATEADHPPPPPHRAVVVGAGPPPGQGGRPRRAAPRPPRLPGHTRGHPVGVVAPRPPGPHLVQARPDPRRPARHRAALRAGARRSEEHTSELQSLMRISYAVFCLKKKKNKKRK